MFSEASRRWNRLPRINLGPGHISLPDPAAAKGAVETAVLSGNPESAAESAATTVNRLQPLVCSRFSESRRADRARAFCGRRISQSLFRPQDRRLHLAHRLF